MTSTMTERDGLTCPFDHHTAHFAENFREIYDELREVGPLIWSESHGGYWIATTHAMVRRLVVDSVGLTVARAPGRVGGILIPAPPGADTRPRFVPGEADGEEHDSYRLALNPHFSKQRVAEMTPMIERHVNRNIDRIIEMGDFDISKDLVAPILSGITCEHMGMQVTNTSRFFDSLMHIVSHGTGGGDDVQREFDESWAYIVQVVNERRAHPTGDVISALAQWEPAFTDEQIHMMILNVSLGANDTTKSLVAQSLIYIDEHPELRARLAANPDEIRPGIDEFLRLLGVAMGPCRTATRDIQVDGITIREGERVMLAYPAANHDPEKYPHPREFDLERGAAQHIALGFGSHFCLGAWLAKSIAATTMRELLARCPNYTVDHANVVIAENRSSLTAFTNAPASVGAFP